MLKQAVGAMLLLLLPWYLRTRLLASGAGATRKPSVPWALKQTRATSKARTLR